jgi:hypothetical protein
MKRTALVQIYRIPGVLSFLTLIGLVSELLGAGMWDMFSWIALLIPCWSSHGSGPLRCVVTSAEIHPLDHTASSMP